MLDILIIGAGGAGLTAALTAKAQGASLLVVGKGYPTNAQTSMAQGGINAVLSHIPLESDSVEAHISDTLKSARKLCDETMVRQMCQDAPLSIEWLDSLGVPFSRTKDTKIAQRQLGGATHKRACYSQDYTGLKILHTLYDNSLKEGIEFLDKHFLINLLTDDSAVPVVKGAIFLDISTGELVEIKAKSVIIATGGYSSIYHGFTTNAFGSTGDGIAAVLRAGGELSDMEFVQFHPTALKSSALLISESARGEGGYLLNSQGERFVDELLPRDVVARAIYEQIDAGEAVFLDIRHLGEAKLMELLPQEVHLCRLHEGVDPLRELIPIKPVAHYSMGGIAVDRSLQVKGLEGCFAVGECSNANLHGANRLGGNSLLELVSFGKKVALSAVASLSWAEREDIAGEEQLERERASISELFNLPNQINFYEKRERVGELLYSNAGIVRNHNDLQEALDAIQEMQRDRRDMGLGDKHREYNSNLVDLLEFFNMLEISEAMLIGAISRKESRGAHYRDDFPLQDDANFAHNSIYRKRDAETLVSLKERMNIQVKRFDRDDESQNGLISYSVPEGLTLLQALQYIKSHRDATLTFDAGCRSGICGTCSVRVNGKEQLSCSYKTQEGDTIEPLQYHSIKRDLVTDKQNIKATLLGSKAWLSLSEQATITIQDEKVTELQSDCILCSSCYSACPVLAVNPDFLGPFALTRVYRYTQDPREGESKESIDAIQRNGVWDCTLCGECTAVCPQGIDPKMDITMLRGKSSQYGYTDPNFATMNFGFDPNAGF